MQRRIYKRGRPTSGWKRTKQVRSLKELPVGTVCIMVADHFKAENLIKIVPVTNAQSNPNAAKMRYYRYIKTNGRKFDGSEMCLWDFELDGPRRVFLAEKASCVK